MKSFLLRTQKTKHCPASKSEQGAPNAKEHFNDILSTRFELSSTCRSSEHKDETTASAPGG